MFGSNYYNHPEVLISSFGEMSGDYKKKAKKKVGPAILLLQKIYLAIFGIPEIGFQVRSQYFEKIIDDSLSNKKIKKILDAGSGIGIYSIWLKDKFSDARVDGWEIDQNKIEFSKKFVQELGLDNVNFVYGDVTKTPKIKSEYDLIVSIDVLEHIENYKKVLQNFYKLLRPGGYLYIHTPQPDQKRIFKTLESWEHEDHVHEGYTPEELVSKLKEIRFKIIKKRETFGFFGKLSWELNHLVLKKGFLPAGLVYPPLYLISGFDILFNNREGLGTAILAQKE